MKRQMSEEFEQFEEEEEVEYEYESDDEVDSVVACVVNGKAQSHKKADTKKGESLTVLEEEESMKTFEIDVFTLPPSMHDLVSKSESHIMRMTFFLEDLNGFVVKGAKLLKPLLENIIALKMREHKAAIIDMDTLESFVETCIIRDFKHLYLNCPVCHTPHAIVTNSLIPCNKDECLTHFTERNLGRDIAVEIKSEPEVVELMITMTYWATLNSQMGYRGYGYNPMGAAPQTTNPADTIRDANFVPFPNKFLFKNVRQYDRIRESLDALPSVQMMKEMISSHTFHAFFKDDVYMQESHYLLTWILNSHRAGLKYVPLTEQTQFEKNLSGGNLHMFRITTPPEREAAFQKQKAKNGNKTEWVYHGSKAGCWHSIIRNSLKNLSNTARMTAGAAYGPGIYLGCDVHTSMGYVGQADTTWQQSNLGITWCILSAEKVVILATNHSGIRVEPNEDNVVNRYLLCGDRDSFSKVTSKAVK